MRAGLRGDAALGADAPVEARVGAVEGPDGLVEAGDVEAALVGDRVVGEARVDAGAPAAGRAGLGVDDDDVAELADDGDVGPAEVDGGGPDRALDQVAPGPVAGADAVAEDLAVGRADDEDRPDDGRLGVGERAEALAPDEGAGLDVVLLELRLADADEPVGDAVEAGESLEALADARAPAVGAGAGVHDGDEVPAALGDDHVVEDLDVRERLAPVEHGEAAPLQPVAEAGVGRPRVGGVVDGGAGRGVARAVALRRGGAAGDRERRRAEGGGDREGERPSGRRVWHLGDRPSAVLGVGARRRVAERGV